MPFLRVRAKRKKQTEIERREKQSGGNPKLISRLPKQGKEKKSPLVAAKIYARK